MGGRRNAPEITCRAHAVLLGPMCIERFMKTPSNTENADHRAKSLGCLVMLPLGFLAKVELFRSLLDTVARRSIHWC